MESVCTWQCIPSHDLELGAITNNEAPASSAALKCAHSDVVLVCSSHQQGLDNTMRPTHNLDTRAMALCCSQHQDSRARSEVRTSSGKFLGLCEDTFGQNILLLTGP
jgi:hypothetical protein